MKHYLIIGALSAFSASALAMPEPVSSVSPGAISTSSISLSWDAVDGAAYYDVYQDNDRIGNIVTDTSFTASNLSAETAYQFFVTACDAEGVCSEASPHTDASTAAMVANMCGTDGPQPVVTYTEVSAGRVELNWCVVDGAEGYNVFINNEYTDTVDAGTTSTEVDTDGDDVFQIAYFGNGEFPPKSDPATPVGDGPNPVEPPVDGSPPVSDIDRFTALESNSLAGDGVSEIFFTRHAEKETELAENDDGTFSEVCGEDKCSEILNAKGELRAELLADAFRNISITSRLTHAFSSHKTRTRQTIEQIVAEAGLTGDDDKFPNDGIQEYPVLASDGELATELNPEGTSASEDPTVAALLNLPAGSTALVAGHSGTLYDIMAGLGLTDVCLEDTAATCNEDRYPINDDFKVANFGDIWKINIVDGVPTFIYRINIQPLQLELNDIAE